MDDIAPRPAPHDASWLAGPVARQLASAAWNETPLGALESWPDALRNAAGLILRSRFPMFLLWGPDHTLLYNEAYAPILGDHHPQAMGRSFWAIWGEVRDPVEPVIAAAFEGQDSFFEDFEVTLVRGGKPEPAWFTFSYSPVYDAAGDIPGVLCVCMETTAAIREAEARAAREAGEARLRFLDRLTAATSDAADADEILATTTRMMVEYMGLSDCAYADMDEDEDGFTIRGDHAAPGAPSIVGHYQLADFGKLAVEKLSAGEPLVINDNLTEIAPEEAATFQAIGISATVCMPLVKDGRLTALMAVHDSKPRRWTDEELALVREVTSRSWANIERVRAEAELRESEARFRLMADVSPQIIWIIDSQGRAEFFNRQWSIYAGDGPMPSDVTQVTRDFVHPDDHAATWTAFEQAQPTGSPFEIEHRIRGADGAYRWFLVRAQPYRDPATGEILRWFGASVDIHDRKLAEARLQELNETLEQRVAEAIAERRVLADIVEGTDAFVQVADTNYRFLAINRASADEFERIFGVRPSVGDSMLDLLADKPQHRAAVEQVWGRALGGEAFTEIGEFGEPGRARRFYEMKFNVLRDAEGRRIGAYQFVYDVTDRIVEQRRLRETEEQLRQSQKLEAIGHLTGGVAHDFNNLLTIIRSSVDLLRKRDLPEERRRRYIEAIGETADRAATLTSQLLAFARRQPLQTTVFDAAKAVERTVEIIRTVVGGRVEIDFQAPETPCRVEVDRNQFETALINMAVNARDAMDGEGRISIRVATASGLPAVRGHAGVAGDFVTLAISDTGQGIAPADLERIFEPFFTTKGVGQGTGLGLSQVYGFAKQSGGEILAQSRPGEGATFTLYLPRVEAAEDGDAPKPRAPAPRANTGRILLVEDNQQVGDFAAQLLNDLGYTTTWVSDAASALKTLELHPRDFDLVFSDVVMPGAMDGVGLAREIRRRRPDLPVVLTSGYSHVLAEGGAGGFELLRKPYSVEALSHLMRKMMRALPAR